MKRGYVGLISVLFVGAIAGVVAVSVLLISLSQSRTSFTLSQSLAVKAMANACAEEALMKIRISTPFEGSGILTFSTGSCTYTVTKGTGQNRSVNAVGYAQTVVRKVSVSVTKINPTIDASWQEVP